MNKPNPLNVFISYSHYDKHFLQSLRRHFKAFDGKIDFWDDSRILAGMNWRQEIEIALEKSKVVILLISADFFNSSFIMENELPVLLEKAEQNGTVILSIILKPCLFNLYPEISKYQSINAPSKTIIQMSEAEKESVWVDLLTIINSILK